MQLLRSNDTADSTEPSAQPSANTASSPDPFVTGPWSHTRTRLPFAVELDAALPPSAPIHPGLDLLRPSSGFDGTHTLPEIRAELSDCGDGELLEAIDGLVAGSRFFRDSLSP